jgi:hypothetical protein
MFPKYLDDCEAVVRLGLSILIAAGATLASSAFLSQLAPALLRLTVTTLLLFGVSAILLCFAMGRTRFTWAYSGNSYVAVYALCRD